MTITTGTHPKLLWPGLKKIWGDAYNDKPMMFSEVFDVQSSDKAYEETQEITGFGLAPVKPEAGSISYDTTVNGYTTRFTNVTYGLGFIVTEEAVEDNQYKAQAEKRTRALKRSMRHTKETVFANILNRAFTAAFAGGDGKEMIATDHPTANGSQSNELTVAADLSETSLEDLFIQMMNATDSRGLRIALMPKKLIVAPANAFNAERILKSTLQNDTANNAVNAIRSKGLLTEGAISWAFLTDADAWFVKSDINDGLLAFNRRALDFQKDGDFETGNFKHKATERYSGGWDDWRGIWGSPGA
jgi:phage major head subunit gpT-like protein